MGAGLDISTGQLADHDSGVLPLATSGSGIDATGGVTPVTGALTGPTYPGIAPMYDDQIAADLADCRAAQSAGMDARDTMLSHYQAQAMPLGGEIGDGMTMPPNPLDPGVGSLGSGETDPFGSFYDPPRPGATETSTAAGTTYMGNTGDQPK